MAAYFSSPEESSNPGLSALADALFLADAACSRGARKAADARKALLESLGDAPVQLSADGMEARACSQLGASLVSHPELLDAMIDRGWALHLFPRQHWSSPFDHLAQIGAAGYALLGKLDAAGVSFFYFQSDDGRHHTGPLMRSAARGDALALDYFLDKLLSQPATERQRAGALASLAYEGLERKKSAPTVEMAMMARLDLFSRLRAPDAAFAAILASISHGKLALAEALLDRPGSAPIPDDALIQCAWSHKPMAAAKLLLARGADPKASGADGQTPLHAACSLGTSGKPLAKLLAKLGADPRAGGQPSTPISLALSSWTLRETRNFLGATDEDLARPGCLDRGFDRAQRAADHPANDLRLAEILDAALGAGAGADAARAMLAAAVHAMPKSFEAAARALRTHKLPAPDSDLLISALCSHQEGEARVAAAGACLALALEGGWAIDPQRALADLARSMSSSGWSGQPAQTEAFSGRARLAVLHGADPSALQDSDGASPLWDAPGWAGSNREFREEIEALRALREAVELKGSIAAPPSLPSARTRSL